MSIPCMNYDEISITAWFYKNANDTVNADSIFGGWKWNASVQYKEGLELRFYSYNPNELQFGMITRNSSGSRTERFATYKFSNSVGSWYHVAGTYNKTTGEQKLYVNGQMVSTTTHPAGNTVVPLTSYSDMRIGHSRVNDGYFNGIIDDVCIYNRTLSSQEVVDIYQLLTGSNDQISQTSQQLCYKFDEGNGTIATDTSGNGNDGTVSGAVWTTGKNGSGLQFDGVDDYVSIPCMNYDEISITAWFYKNANDTVNADSIFGGWKWNASVQYKEGLELRFYSYNSNELQFGMITKNSSGNRLERFATYKFSNSVGSWYHVAGTYNKATGEQKLYVNGQLVNTTTHPAGNTIVPLTSYSDMRIGHSRVNDGYFNGIIDDVRIYNRALSSQEVLDAYTGKS
ncbi:MAG: hypothetical protein CV087_23275 [Candidatus Brocadia sp. WS118]|nr:MAG: hypothetical protein CV087_23275 [Candidatus Brocadia sp. WS118]